MGEDMEIIQFKEVLGMIRQSRHKAMRSVNTELIDLYWKIGEYISIKVENDDWGKGVVKYLSEYILENEPGIRGFSVQNLWRMKQFYETYRSDEKLSSLLRELSWTCNLMILSKTSSHEEKEFYLKLAAKEKYSSRDLERQINSCIFERYLSGNKKLSTVLAEIHPKGRQIVKDPYIFDFLDLPEPYDEKDVKRGIVNNMKLFLLEFGKDLAFIGEEYRIQVGKSDFFIDLLFYHRELRCLVAFELKIGDFTPEYVGKMNFYLEALDRDEKKPSERPSVGIILCRGKDDTVVEYALSRSLSPTLVAEYRTKLIKKEILQRKLREFSAMGR